MCGITGVFAFNLLGKLNMIHVTSATLALEKRGPDAHDVYTNEYVGLGHRRLSIIDTSAVANQPMWDAQKRFCIVFNGEIFNYRELRSELEAQGIRFSSSSDTEVLLYLFIREKENCLNKLNGFFAFCVYDRQEQTFFLARDRYGIKPLLYLFDEDKFLFASEMKSMLQYGIDKELDYTSLQAYLHLNYIPAPHTIFTQVKKLLPGHYLKISSKKLESGRYYAIAEKANPSALTYEQATVQFKDLLEDSVKRRLVADVPVGAFLSGGVDSSVITALAVKHKPDLHTFSIGFRDDKFFDETTYANAVAKHLKTNHTVFSLTHNDLLAHVHHVLNYTDEPFADSSTLNVYILSKETRKHATVALSGDGADELLGGYNKHAAFNRIIHKGWKENLITSLAPVWKLMPQSRSGKAGNLARQLNRFAEGMKLDSRERYWQWAGFTQGTQAGMLLRETRQKLNKQEFESRKENYLRYISSPETMREILLTDMHLVLPGDMLTKVDSMSMANSLEVRVPFLDYRVVDFVFNLPDEFKINRSMRKRILQDAFRDELPAQLYNRPKKGFEVPMLNWLRKELNALTDDLLSEKNISEQGIFNYAEVQKLKAQLNSSNPQDVHARLWALLVFQAWYKKYIQGLPVNSI
ncbi:MAG: asparagine synthase (glutamine-hydrolyzing) [Cyclobacteriaceae bacterium]|nr:asparagine synthase (glutamine-hydrolyzing) [Cyclobacteriaceae bacterium]